MQSRYKKLGSFQARVSITYILATKVNSRKNSLREWSASRKTFVWKTWYLNLREWIYPPTIAIHLEMFQSIRNERHKTPVSYLESFGTLDLKPSH